MEQQDLFSRTTICLPTYNEAENLPLIVEKALAYAPGASILIIDDNSPDGTGAVADRLAGLNSAVDVLHREKKEGLGKAYCAGFRRLLEKGNVDYIIQMDADFSHPPGRIPALMKAAVEGADLVIGSRYVEEGGVFNWDIVRRLLSQFGNIYSRLWLGIPVADLTGGFKLWRKELLQKVLEHDLDSGGYVFQVETTYRAWNAKARIVEIPILFSDRNVGASKMTFSIAFEAVWRVPAMRLFGK